MGNAAKKGNQPPQPASLSELTKNPKTLKALRKNTEILKSQSQDPDGGDDYFATQTTKKMGNGKKAPMAAAKPAVKSKVGKKGKGGRNAAQIANDLFNSDSDHDMMSMHSA